jgi:hypothetical protein
MDEATRAEVALTVALADARLTLNDLAVRLKREPGVAKVVTSIDCVFQLPERNPSLELYTDASLTDGRSIAWLLSADWDGAEWIIDSRVEEYGGLSEQPPGGPPLARRLVEFPRRQATAGGLSAELLRAVSELASAEVPLA